MDEEWTLLRCPECGLQVKVRNMTDGILYPCFDCGEEMVVEE
jgi:hypothetical protein